MSVSMVNEVPNNFLVLKNELLQEKQFKYLEQGKENSSTK